MTRTMSRLLSAGGAVATVVAVVALLAAPASALPYDGTDPVTSGCSSSQVVVKTASILSTRDGSTLGHVDLYWSKTCHTNWAEVRRTATGGLGNWSVVATAHRPSDGAFMTYSGATYVWTDQLYGEGLEVCAVGTIGNSGSNGAGEIGGSNTVCY